MDKYMTMTKHLTLKGLVVLNYAANQRVTQHSLLLLIHVTVDSRMQYGLHITSSTSKKAMFNVETKISAK